MHWEVYISDDGLDGWERESAQPAGWIPCTYMTYEPVNDNAAIPINTAWYRTRF
jgi:hypothetical protein